MKDEEIELLQKCNGVHDSVQAIIECPSCSLLLKSKCSHKDCNNSVDDAGDECKECYEKSITTTAMTQDEKDALCAQFYEDTGIDLKYTLDNGVFDDADELMEDLLEQADQVECIYYNNAMEYLREHDPSLQYSLGIAHDMGYTADKLNSELLATLLMQQNTRETVEEYRDEIEKLFDEANHENCALTCSDCGGCLDCGCNCKKS